MNIQSETHILHKLHGFINIQYMKKLLAVLYCLFTYMETFKTLKLQLYNFTILFFVAPSFKQIMFDVKLIQHFSYYMKNYIVQ